MSTHPGGARDPVYLFRSLTRVLFGLLALFVALTPTAVTFAQDAAIAPAPRPADQPSVSPPNSPGVAAIRQAKNLAIITIHGEIDERRVMAVSVQRRIQAAVSAGADCIVFDIHTPGGEVNSILEICEAIKACPVSNTIAWVNTQAISGGAIIALACREIVSNDQATFGDAMPIHFDPKTKQIVGLRGDALRKVLPPLVAQITDSARRYNKTFGGYIRDEYLLQAIVASDVDIWWVRNKQTGQCMAVDVEEYKMLFPGQAPPSMPRLGAGPASSLVDGPPVQAPIPPKEGVPANSSQLAAVAETVAKSMTQSSDRPVLTPADAGKWESLGRVTNGRTAAIFNAGQLHDYNLSANPTEVVNGVATVKPMRSVDDLKAFTGAQNVVRYDMVWSEHLVDFLTGIVVRGILIVIFLVALFIEMSHPGVILPGVIALIALGALLAPPFLIGMASWWEIAAILVGLVLLGIEAFVIPGFGVTGILGVLLLFGGLVATFTPGSNVFPDTPEGKSDMLWGVATIFLSIFTAGIAMWGISKHFGSLPMLNRLVLKSTPPDEASESMLAAMDPELDMDVRPGDAGVTITPMRPAGRVDVNGKVIDAVAEIGFIDAGASVRVTSVSGLRIAVEATSSPTPPNTKGTEA